MFFYTQNRSKWEEVTDIANKCKGIIIEVGGDTKPLVKELSEANKTSRSLQSELRDVEKLLKLDL